MTELTELLLRPLADAFMQVGVFVALLAAPFGWAQWRHGDRLDALLVRHARLAPLLAAAVTMPPGCGGAAPRRGAGPDGPRGAPLCKARS